MKKLKITLIGIVALIGVIVIMPSCDIIYDILTTPSTQVDNNNNENDNSKTSKGKKQANSNDSNDPNSSSNRGN